jgi:signal transduction histidine kinase
MCTPFPYINKQGPIILAFTILLESLLVFLIFRIKRFKNGFTFFQNKEYNYDLILLLSGIVILIFINLGYYKDNSINHYSLLGLTLILLSMFLWIKEKITLHYKSLLTKDTIENLQNQLDEQISINKNMKNEIDKLSTINHKFSSRINALELHVANLSTKLTSNENISNNILESKELINRLSTEFSNELKLNLENDFLINKTGIINIDNILDYFYLKCRNKNISFDVIVKTNIKDSVNNAISLNLLETLIADMITNSIIAIGYSSNNNSSILVQFDSSDYFEFRIYDTGIEFEIDTLINLGKERITTHKEDGGSGIGFFTTFETLNRTNGSLVIEEYPPDNANFNYSKCLIFRFDNNRKYIIRSYRYKEIEKFSYTELITKPLFI